MPRRMGRSAYVPGEDALARCLRGNETYTELRMRFGETRMFEIVREA